LDTNQPDREPEEGWLGRGLRFLSVIAVGLALATYLHKLWEECRLPALTADSLIYHLAIPAQWLQRGFLQEVDLPFHDGAAEHSPLFMETVIYGLMRLTGNDTLAFFLQPACFLLLVALFHRSLRLLEVSPDAARFLASLVLLFPPFFHSSLQINSELVMTCGVAAFVFGMLLTREKQEPGWYVAAAGVAITLATKTVGVIYGSVALLMFIGWFVRVSSADFAEGRRWGSVRIWRGVICAAIVLCGLAFHFRNLWEHGNPLYPAELRVLGLRILPGRYNTSVLVNHGWSPRAFSKMLFSDDVLFAMNTQFGGALWLAMLVPLVLAARRKLTSADLLSAALFVVYPLLCVLIYFTVVPFWSEHRLLFPVYYLLWGGFGWSLNLLMRGRGALVRDIGAGGVGLGFAGHAFFFLLFSKVPLLLLVAAVVVGLVVANYPRLLAWMSRWPWAVPVAAAAVLAVSSPWWYPDLARERAINRDSNYPQRYGTEGAAWTGFDEYTADKPATIAYAGTSHIYPLFGPKLANRVVYVPIHPEDHPGPVTLTSHRTIYQELAHERRKKSDEGYWLEQLQAGQVDYLLIVRSDKFDDPLIERTFAAKHPELFRQIYHEQDVWVYAVRRK
jgi:hypothetical protein